MHKHQGTFPHKSLGRQIRADRRARTVTQAELAKMAHVTQSYLSNIEQGRRRPAIETLERIADSLGTSEDVYRRLGSYGEVAPESATVTDYGLSSVLSAIETTHQEQLARVARIGAMLRELNDVIREGGAMRAAQREQEAAH